MTCCCVRASQGTDSPKEIMKVRDGRGDKKDRNRNEKRDRETIERNRQRKIQRDRDRERDQEANLGDDKTKVEELTETQRQRELDEYSKEDG